MESLRTRRVEVLGRGIDNWCSVDTFACLVAGACWREGRVTDDAVHRWACSRDRWWRRAAVVSTVALNHKSRGGSGDARRTVAVCDLVADDHDDMVNRASTTGRVEELEEFFHEEVVAITPTDRERVEGREACIAGWAEFVGQAKILDWKESDPRVRVFGDDATVVTYYYDMLVEMGGTEMRLAGRHMFLMVEEDGRWVAVADQFSEYPGG